MGLTIRPMEAEQAQEALADRDGRVQPGHPQRPDALRRRQRGAIAQ
jgi:hypothetical protein